MKKRLWILSEYFLLSNFCNFFQEPATDFKNGFGTVDEDLFTFESVEVKKGDVLVFNANLIHRSGKLANDKVTRWSAHFRYNNMHDEDFISKMYPHPYEYKNVDHGKFGKN